MDGDDRRFPAPGRWILLATLAWAVVFWSAGSRAAQSPQSVTAAYHDATFQTSHDCLACHNGLMTPSGEDVSIGLAWRASMMANSSRDPYWQAAVRREVMDHPSAREEIEDECSVCHMPMTTTLARAGGGRGDVFAHLPIPGQTPRDRLAADGVSCTLCHQIGPDRLGGPDSFTGGYVINATGAVRQMFGPFEVDEARTTLMRSATTADPAKGEHLRQSEMCATCHTLFTQAFDVSGSTVVGRLPEQTPYLEWRESSFREERSCQSCHMPAVAESTRIASVLGDLREGLARHTFIGGNFFMLRMLNRYRGELGVEASPAELEAAAHSTLRQLEASTADLSVSPPVASGNRVSFEVHVENRTGHKLPTGYPSRRVWLHVAVRDGAGDVVFESGAFGSDGSIVGNDSDADGSRYEPHHEEIRSADQVQVYESVMTDVTGAVTTGLLYGAGYVKDNRLLPRGFDKAVAPADVAVTGAAMADPDFGAAGDRVRYSVEVGGATGPFTVEAVLRYQPIAYRWADNLRAYDAPETRRFVAFYDTMSVGSSTVLARATTQQ